jgi:hypothetical protein
MGQRAREIKTELGEAEDQSAFKASVEDGIRYWADVWCEGAQDEWIMLRAETKHKVIAHQGCMTQHLGLPIGIQDSQLKKCAAHGGGLPGVNEHRKRNSGRGERMWNWK